MMIGRLAPAKYQGVVMGAWMLVTALASLFANDFSGSIPEVKGDNPAATNAEYAKLFGTLGWGTVAVAVVMALLIPFLRKLIREKEQPEPEVLEPAAVAR